MTCTGFYLQGKDAFAFSDGVAYDGRRRDKTTEPKFFKVGEAWFAYTSSFRMGDLLKYQLNLPERPENISDTEYVKKLVVEEIRSVFKKFGYTYVDNNRESAGTFLILYKGVIYRFCDDLQCTVLEGNLQVVGSGDIAMTAAMMANKEPDIEKRLKECLKITGDIVNSVSDPYFVEKL